MHRLGRLFLLSCHNIYGRVFAAAFQAPKKIGGNSKGSDEKQAHVMMSKWQKHRLPTLSSHQLRWSQAVIRRAAMMNIARVIQANTRMVHVPRSALMQPFLSRLQISHKSNDRQHSGRMYGFGLEANLWLGYGFGAVACGCSMPRNAPAFVKSAISGR